MACAVGGCAGCTVKVMTPDGPAMKRVCVDGPVFDSTRGLRLRAGGVSGRGHYFAALHHHADLAHRVDVHGRIALHRHQVGQQTRADRATLSSMWKARALTEVAAASTSSAGMPYSCMSSSSRALSPCANTPTSPPAQMMTLAARAAAKPCVPAPGLAAAAACRPSPVARDRIAGRERRAQHDAACRAWRGRSRACRHSRARWCRRRPRWRGACLRPCWRAPRPCARHHARPRSPRAVRPRRMSGGSPRPAASDSRRTA